MNVTAADAAGDAFGSLIAPVATPTFFERYFESDVLHVARADGTYFAGLYSAACVEDALLIGATDLDRFALIARDAPALPRENFVSERAALGSRSGRAATQSVIDPRGVLAAFAAGYTLYIKDAGSYHPPLALLCNRIQAQTGFYTQVNVYFTPPNAQGFEIHHDTHDTLILQIEGEKNWRVYDPVLALPLEDQPFVGNVHPGAAAPRVIPLAAGDTLYIPRGFPHAAATAQRRSLHLTFSISALRVADLLESLVRLAARDDVELRRALPPDWQRDPTFASALSSRLAATMAHALAPERMALAAELSSNALFAATRTTAAGNFDTLRAFEALLPTSRLALRDDVPFALRAHGQRLDIVLAAKVVSVPAAARAGFARLAAGPATLAQLAAVLPGGTAPSFVRTLVFEGLIRIEAAAPSDS